MAPLGGMLFVVLTSLICLQHVAESNLQIAVHPSEILLGLAEPLTVNCSFTVDGTSNMAALISLILSRANESGQSFTELAALTAFSPHNVTLLTSETATAEGSFDQGGETYFYVRWEVSSVPQAGLYECSAHGVDILGHTILETRSVQVTLNEANLGDCLNTIGDIRQQLTEKNILIKTLQDTVAQMENKTKILEETIASLQKENILLDTFVSPLTYKNHKYYLSRDGYDDVNNAADICKQHEGYLVEIDDTQEYAAIQNFLKNTSTHPVVLTAGTDEAHEGVWIYPSTGLTVPILDWLSNEPDHGTTGNCLVLAMGSITYGMGDYMCQISSPSSDFLFMCEMPDQ